MKKFPTNSHRAGDPVVVEVYQITGRDGGTGEPIDVTKSFESMPGFALAKEVAEDWAYNYADKGAVKLERVG